MKKIVLFLTILFMISLTGCVQEFKISETQSDAAAEYMAGLLLKYDKDYAPQLAPRELIEREVVDSSVNSTPTPAPEDELIIEGNGDKAEETKDYTLTEVIGVPDLDVMYSKYQMYDSYPEDTTNSYFSLTPYEGNQFLVATFLAKNISDKKITISHLDVRYQLDINVGKVYKPSFTLLENDLQYIEITIGAGETETVLLVFEISKETDISDINLIASKDNRTEIIEIK